jgi:isopenicillin N synthase-like dioxygenase
VTANSLPIIDVAALSRGPDPVAARRLSDACSGVGFFYVVGHGVDPQLERDLERHSAAFFALDHASKMDIAMARGGRAWRGYFPVGAELTSGFPDQKEGLYLGRELPEGHPLVQARTPLHGPNLFPEQVPQLKATVLAYMEAMTRLGHVIMSGLAAGLGLDPDYFAAHYTSDPLVLFRIFHYPAVPDATDAWGVGEHTDYGLLTILKQDDVGGLEVKSRARWIDAPPIPGSYICNLGDMLDRMTGGHYRSTPHRVRVQRERNRFSYPFFFDPNYFARVQPVPTIPRASEDKHERWDGKSVHEFTGTYGEYLVDKVSKVFPQLRGDVLL